MKSLNRWLHIAPLVRLDTDAQVDAYVERVWKTVMAASLDELAEFNTDMERSRPGNLRKAEAMRRAGKIDPLELDISQRESVASVSVRRRRDARRAIPIRRMRELH